MSLALSLYNHHGIVMCADKMINSTFNKNCVPITICQSLTEQKLFLLDNHYGLSFTGSASINSIPVSSMIEDYISSNALKNAHPTDWLANLVSYFQRNIHNGEHIVFTLCGYYLGEKNILTTNTSVPNNIRSITEKAGLLYSGETILLSHLVNSDLAAFDYAKFTMQDSIDFLRFLIKTVSGLMHFGQMIPTVSYDCDVLALFSNEACWIEHSELH